ncbi:MAG: hypothetical protein Q8L45_15535 [Xanthomonadaceae bacterium]|nr:hypothetical protein [Xanthomonadaceae bacterium]MDP2186860.1 hypothetical protein [Xanthomonadales bacterium]MDZ4114935.1 hypothetical protein [Xanthomonadaceae bacterium]MDZ4377447.1 hypothetical protein [Xanthomonadaceae bacterium]
MIRIDEFYAERVIVTWPPTILIGESNAEKAVAAHQVTYLARLALEAKTIRAETNDAHIWRLAGVVEIFLDKPLADEWHRRHRLWLCLDWRRGGNLRFGSRRLLHNLRSAGVVQPPPHNASHQQRNNQGRNKQHHE